MKKVACAPGRLAGFLPGALMALLLSLFAFGAWAEDEAPAAGQGTEMAAPAAPAENADDSFAPHGAQVVERELRAVRRATDDRAGAAHADRVRGLAQHLDVAGAVEAEVRVSAADVEHGRDRVGLGGVDRQPIGDRRPLAVAGAARLLRCRRHHLDRAAQTPTALDAPQPRIDHRALASIVAAAHG